MKPYYQHAGITIYHGDCVEVLPELDPVDLVLTDPPYGIGISSNPVRQKHDKSDWDAAVPDPGLISRIISSGAQAIVWGGNYFGLPPHQCFLAWDKKQPERFSLAMLEIAWTNLGGPAKMFRMSVTSYRKDHPTQKPILLMSWCISKAEDPKTILDPFMGSGTTLRAAKDLGLQATGIEISEKYCEIAARRLSQDVLNFV